MRARRFGLVVLLLGLGLLLLVPPAWGAVAIDGTNFIFTSSLGAGSITINVTVGNNANRALALFVGILDTGAVAVSTVTGAGCTWAQSATGTGTVIRGEIWGCPTPSTGAQTVTVSLSGTPTTEAYSILYSLTGASQANQPLSSPAVVAANPDAVTVAAGDLALAVQFDTNNNRTVSGCTSTTDLSTFGVVGYSSANCTTAPTSTFTWSGYGAESIGMGVTVLQAGAGNKAGPLAGDNVLNKAIVGGGLVQ